MVNLGLSGSQMRFASGLFAAITAGSIGLNFIKSGGELGGLGDFFSGATGFSREEISESTLRRYGRLVYGNPAQKLGSLCNNGLKFGAVALCPQLGLPLALTEVFEAADEFCRPDGFGGIARAKDLLIDIPMALTTAGGLACMSMNFGKFGKFLKLFSEIANKRSALLQTWKASRNTTDAAKTIPLIKEQLASLQNKKKVLERIASAEQNRFFTSLGLKFGRYLQPCIKAFKSGLAKAEK